jgi:L-2-hydroxyglutarate oxidase LhgO
MDKVECVVIGAGVIGLAVARRLAQAGREVIVLEAAEGIGTVTSSRNSEVIHAGIYYPAQSLMARMCVGGRRALYQYCGDHGIPHRNCGKLIVATTPKETEKLQSIRAHAEANGVLDLQTLSGEAARAMEPALNCDAALLSPSTGIIDSHAYMLALRGDAEDAGAAFAFHTPLLRARASADRIELNAGGDAPVSLECRLLVNAAGLAASAVARNIDGMPIERIPRAYLAKGNYFSCSTRAPFSHLIYPVPEPGGLGVHLTLDMAGQARFGPDVEWVESIDYAVDPARAERFYPAIRPDAAGRRADAQLFRHTTEDRAAGGGRAGFPDPGSTGSWHRRADQFVRDRIAGTDVIAGDRGLCRRACRGVSVFAAAPLNTGIAIPPHHRGAP